MKEDPIISIIYNVMCDGRWYTIPELRSRLALKGRKALDTSISARIRDLRKAPWNRRVYRRTRAGSAHLEEYALFVADMQQDTRGAG